jgi:hypothetical protein
VCRGADRTNKSVRANGYRSLKFSSYGGVALSLSLSGHSRNVFEILRMTERFFAVFFKVEEKY